MFLPLAFALRRRWVYQRLIFIGSSLVAAAIASIWLAECVGNFKLLPL